MSKRRMRDRHSKTIHFEIDEKTQREIAIIILWSVGAVLGLAYFQLAGSAGVFLDKTLSLLLGSVRPLLFLALFALGPLALQKGIRGGNILGMIILIAVSSALTHLLTAPAGKVEALSLPLEGGYLGVYLSLPLYRIFGFWATFIILFALLFTSLSLLLPSPLGRLLSSTFLIFRMMGEIIGLGSRILRFFRRGSQSKEQFDTPSSSSNFEVHTLNLPSEPEPYGLAPEASMETKEEKKNKEFSDASQANAAKRRRINPHIQIPMDLLERNGSKPTAGDIRGKSMIIQKTLNNFGIDVEMGEVAIGPTVTQYTLRPHEGIKLSSITALTNDLALALAAPSIRIEAPIPGKSLVGIEVPNEHVSVVKLREIMESASWSRRGSNLSLALGKDVAGNSWVADLTRMPHLLVAGSTGSGKTVCLNTLIVSLLYQNGPGDLKFLLIDPKRVELPVYNEIPHLISPVITDVKRTVEALRWTVGEMEQRFEKLENVGARDIKNFNERLREGEERMPYLVVVVDELADLLAAAASSVEASIIRLAQMARAVGIHLILATQRPSVDILTGLIKANITSRIAFSVASLVDSRTILDTAGAEKLLGRGDMLFTTPELGKPRRLQGAYIGDAEIRRVVEYLRQAGEPEYIEIGNREVEGIGREFEDGEGDPLLPEAKRIILQAGKASASLLQRRLKIGYARAARVLDLLEAEGFISPGEGAKPREILQKEEEGVRMSE